MTSRDRDDSFFTTYQYESKSDAETTLNALLDIIQEGTWDWDANSGIVIRSPGWYRLLGYDIGSFGNDVFTWENIIHPDDYNRVMKHFERYISGEIEQYRIEYRCKKSDDTYLWIVDQGKIIARNKDGSVARMIGAHQSIDAQKKAQLELVEQNMLLEAGNRTLESILSEKADELVRKNLELQDKIRKVEYISDTDTLTHIPNRRKFEEIISTEIHRAQRYGHPLSLIIMDLDHFKTINDQHGHKRGDQALVEVATLLKANIREYDFVARWGGEEFAIVLPNQGHDDAIKAAEKIRQIIETHEASDSVSITSSFGVTQYIQDEPIEQFFSRADRALYRAKEMGRNRVEIY